MGRNRLNVAYGIDLTFFRSISKFHETCYAMTANVKDCPIQEPAVSSLLSIELFPRRGRLHHALFKLRQAANSGPAPGAPGWERRRRPRCRSPVLLTPGVLILVRHTLYPAVQEPLFCRSRLRDAAIGQPAKRPDPGQDEVGAAFPCG